MIADNIMRDMSLDTTIDVESLAASGGVRGRVIASAEECTMLAERFGFIDLSNLSALVKITKSGPDNWSVSGKLKADVTQACVITGEPVPELVDFEIEERYARATDDGTEIDVSLDGAEPLVDGAIDIGEIVAQSLALAVNPWPRTDGVPESFEAGGNQDTHPFAALAALKSSE
jgi:uncharacterized metal-binding protein YceD (DUF177 family)